MLNHTQNEKRGDLFTEQSAPLSGECLRSGAVAKLLATLLVTAPFEASLDAADPYATRSTNAISLPKETKEDPKVALERAMVDWRAKNYTNAVNQLLILTNSVDAMFYVGVAKGNGYGTPKDDAVALKYFERAGNLGHTDAQYNAGVLHELGIGTVANFKKAMEWYEKSSESGSKEAAESLYKTYLRGEKGITKNLQLAFMHAKRAADRGSSDAAYYVGLAYLSGEGVVPDGKSAATYLTQAAKEGIAGAQYSLAGMYAQRGALGPNFEQTAYWLGEAVKLKFAPAMGRLGEYYLNGWGGLPFSAERAIALFRSGAAQKDSYSEYYLGRCYLEGNGTSPNAALGIKYLNLAIAHGATVAEEYVKNFEQQQLSSPMIEMMREYERLLEQDQGRRDRFQREIEERTHNLK